MADEFEIRGPSVSGPPVPISEFNPNEETTAQQGAESVDIRPPTAQDEQKDISFVEPFAQGIVTGAGALHGYGERKEYKAARQAARQRTADLEILKKMAQQSAQEAAIASQAAQTPFERAIQGAREDVTGTTGRARQQTYTTETSRQAAARRGVDNPFTRGVWGATDQGVLAPPQAISESERIAAQNRENLARAAMRREALMTAVKAPLSTVLDWASRSKLLGALSGGMAGYEAYEAYQAAKEGRTADALSSGLSALGGAIGTIPTPATVGIGAALGLTPLAIQAMRKDQE